MPDMDRNEADYLRKVWKYRSKTAAPDAPAPSEDYDEHLARARRQSDWESPGLDGPKLDP